MRESVAIKDLLRKPTESVRNRAPRGGGWPWGLFAFEVHPEHWATSKFGHHKIWRSRDVVDLEELVVPDNLLRGVVGVPASEEIFGNRLCHQMIPKPSDTNFDAVDFPEGDVQVRTFFQLLWRWGRGRGSRVGRGGL